MTEAGKYPHLESVCIKSLLQELIDNIIDPVTFTKKMQRYGLDKESEEKNVQILKNFLPSIQKYLETGEICIDGIKPQS